ncbi:MAG: NAD+ synthase [Bacteroidota bacterium]
MLRIALAQLNYHVGNLSYNKKLILETIQKSILQKVDLLVFSELSLCGYPPLDLLNYAHFIQQCSDELKEIVNASVDISIILGAPIVNPDINGKNLFNAAVLIQDGKITEIRNKSLLPTYDIFDEYRWFEPNVKFSCINVNNTKIALTVCEDLWNIESDPLYTNWPMNELVKESPDLMINIAASPFDYNHDQERKTILQKNVLKYNLPLVYVNQVGGNTDFIFDGGSLIMNSDGSIVNELNYFKEDYSIVEYNNKTKSFIIGEIIHSERPSKISKIKNALLLGIKDYFKKSGFSKAIIGLSGGIDSAVVLTLAAEALGSENVHAVLMPSEFSSEHSIDDALVLVKNLNCSHEIIPIADIYNRYESSLSNAFKGTVFNVAEENIQSRIRGTLLMALSNKFGYILLNTSNKSELAVGYGTLYGDMCGGLSVIGDLYKSEVYELANYINRHQEIIPVNSIQKAPSAELRPNQKDADSLPDYSLLDAILFEYIENAKGVKEIIDNIGHADTVTRIIKMVNANEWKRNQFAPIIRVSTKSFGRGRRMPIVAKFD